MDGEKRNLEEPDFEPLDAEERRRSIPAVAALLLVVIAVAVALTLFLKGGRDEEEIPAGGPTSVVEDRSQRAAPTGGETIPGAGTAGIPEGPASGREGPAPGAVSTGGAEAPGSGLPPLDESGDLAADLLSRCLGAGMPSGLRHGGNLIRLFVVIVDNVAEGASPRPHLGFLDFTGEFSVVERKGALLIDPASYRRFDGIARIFSNADVESCAEAYRKTTPLIDEAYRDLGYPGRAFEDTLRKALRRVIEVPVPEGDVLLLRGEGAFHFEDPDIEALSGIERQIIRMGPENARIMQRALRDFRAAIDR